MPLTSPEQTTTSTARAATRGLGMLTLFVLAGWLILAVVVGAAYLIGSALL